MPRALFQISYHIASVYFDEKHSLRSNKRGDGDGQMVGKLDFSPLCSLKCLLKLHAFDDFDENEEMRGGSK